MKPVAPVTKYPMLNTLPIAGNRGGPYRLCRFPGPFDRMPETMLEAPVRREGEVG